MLAHVPFSVSGFFLDYGIIFSILNMNTRVFERKASKILSVLGNPFRVKLALALSDQEACVCHLETYLKKRQAFISQHLMALREAELLETRREGKYVFYRLASPDLIDLIQMAAKIAGYEPDVLPGEKVPAILDSCICPKCESEEIKN